jgi:hypothetical protein
VRFSRRQLGVVSFAMFVVRNLCVRNKFPSQCRISFGGELQTLSIFVSWLELCRPPSDNTGISPI